MKVIPLPFHEEEVMMRMVINVLNLYYDWLPNIGMFESRQFGRTPKSKERQPITTVGIEPERLHALIFKGSEPGMWAIKFWRMGAPLGRTQHECVEGWEIKSNYGEEGAIWVAHELAELFALYFYYERGYFDKKFVQVWDKDHSLASRLPPFQPPEAPYDKLMTAQDYWDHRLNPKPEEKDNVSAKRDSGRASTKRAGSTQR